MNQSIFQNTLEKYSKLFTNVETPGQNTLAQTIYLDSSDVKNGEIKEEEKKEQIPKKDEFSSIFEEPNIDNLYDNSKYAEEIDKILLNWKDEINVHLSKINSYSIPLESSQNEFVSTLKNVNNLTSLINIIQPDAVSTLDKLTQITNEQDNLINELTALDKQLDKYKVEKESKVNKEKELLDNSKKINNSISEINGQIHNLERIYKNNIFTNEKSSMNEYVKKDIIEVYNEIDNLKKEEINLIQKLSKQTNIL